MNDSRDRRPASETPSFENLEQRMLLSGDGPSVGSVMWRGSEIEAVRDSFVVTFSQAFEDTRAEAAVEFLSSRLGVELTNFERLGLGFSAQMDVEGRVRPKRVDRLMDDLAWLRGIDPNITYEPEVVPNDPRFTEQWQLENTGQIVGGQPGVVGADSNLLSAWDVTTGSIDTIVAVIDTGVDLDHPDLEANIYVNPGETPGNGVDDDGNGFVDDVNGWDFGENDNNPNDAAGHGTLVAGTIAAVGNNGFGVSGVMWTGSIMPMKIADRFGFLSLAAIVGAHDYLTMMRGRGVNIVASNNSYGTFSPVFFEDQEGGFPAERDAIQRFIDSGGVFVASAGNDANDNDGDFTSFPAAYDLPGIVAVAATDNTDSLSTFSSFGAETVDLAAPGTLVRTTQIDGGFASVSGTSFSAPMVAGAVGLLKTLRPQSSGAEIRQVLIDSSRPVASLQNRVQSGGVLDVAEALRIIDLDGPVITAVDPGPVTGQLDGNGDPRNELVVIFNKDIDPAFLDTGFVSLIGSGNDDTFGTGDDRDIPIDSIALEGTRTVRIQLNLLGFLQQRLPIDNYQLTLNDAGFRDLDGNFLNGNGDAGEDEVYDFEIVPSTGTLEPNDTLGTAEPLTFAASGSAEFTGLTLGDGARAGLDVDLFAINIPRGGLINAEVVAQNRPGGSNLDSYLRLFDGLGNEIAANDQFNGRDSLIDFFVSTGGTYYLGVSGFPNSQYNPNIAGSGVSQATGVYDLSIDVELVQNDRVTATENLAANPARIPPQGSQGIFSTTINFADTREIRDLNVRLDILHEFDSDLRISLISPSGTVATLVNRRGASGDNFDSTLLDDEASVPISSGSAPFDRQGGYRPDDALSTFDGESAGGTWTLVINDTKSLDTGFLLNWSLDFTLLNNIFGAFESNDTIPTATPLQGINGSGAVQLQASVGDGGFGGLDRDIYEFDAFEGSTLNATAASFGSLNSALQLFDEDGNRLRLANPNGSLDATISNFVFNAGGTFYIAVSEANNVNYSPFDVTTGNPSQTTGAYILDLTLSAGVSDDPRILDGVGVDLGIGANGTFLAGAGANRTGLSFNGVEFLFSEAAQGFPMHFYGGSAGGSVFRNGGGTGSSLPVSLTDQSDLQNQRLVGESTFNGLAIDRATSFGIGDNFVAVDVIITNTTGQRIDNIQWMEAFNPEQGLNFLQGTTANTSNDILADGGGTLPAGIASFSNNLFPNGLSVMLAAPAADSRAQLTFFDPTRDIRDPSVLMGLGVNDPNGTSADQAMGLSYELGNLNAGQTTTLRYFVLLGESEADALAMYDAINDGTGRGHLTANPATPATEQLITAPGDDNDEAATLPYRVYYPEGFANGKTSTFVPILNPHGVSNRVQIIARYEFGDRDQIISEEVIPAGQRGGVTITTPELFAAGNQLVRARTPYAIEIRSQLPVAANFSHYDLFLLTDGPAAVGEAFTNQLNEVFTFAGATKNASVSDFLLYMNTSDEVTKVTTTFFPTGGGQAIQITQTFQPFRRGGLSLKALNQLPAGSYGVLVDADTPIIASLTHFDRGAGTAYGVVGTPGGGDVRGAIPEGQIGLNSVGEVIGVLNANSQRAEVLFSFIFQNGTTFRTNLSVNAQSRAELDVAALRNFPSGQPYSVLYEVQNGDLPVSLVLPTKVFGDEFASSFSDKAFTLWGFGEGFRPKREGNVTEFLRLFNPADTDVAVEITIHFDGGLGSETFRAVLPGRRVQEFDVHDFVTGDRRNQQTFYGLTVKAADPIVAYMGHFDGFFPGGFGTLGTPLGASQNV